VAALANAPSGRYNSPVSTPRAGDGDAPPPDDTPQTVAVGPWRRRTRRTVYQNPWLEVWHDEVDRPDGRPGIYGVVHFASRAVGVVAVDDDGRILLVGQHRYTLDTYSWEIPEGGVDLHETMEEGARRELREETGFEAATWRRLFRFSTSNSVTDEVGEMFLAGGLRAGTPSPDDTEDLTARWATLDEVLAEIARGEIHDLMTIAAVQHYALRRRQE
jgi:8-oxo-dGTP pyrophosphatase MutT (NUDIX family)